MTQGLRKVASPRRRAARPRGVVIALSILLIAIGNLRAAEEPPPRILSIDDPPITVEFMEKDRKVADKVSSICTASAADIASELGLDSVGRFRIVLVPEMAEYRRRLGLPAWGVAFAFTEQQVMLVDVKKAVTSLNSLEKVIPHELSHILLSQRIGGVRPPAWFMEGLALWQSREWSIFESWQLMEAVWGNRDPTLGEIYDVLPAEENRARDAYRVAYAGFTTLFDGKFELLPGFLDEVRRRGNFSDAFRSFWKEDEFAFYERFAHDMRRKYRARLLLFQTGPLFSVVAFLFLLVYLRVKLRNRRKLKEFESVNGGYSVDDA